MRSLEVLAHVLDYIEDHIKEDFSLQVLADTHYISLSYLHRLFTCLHRESLREYIEKRRLSLIGVEIILSDQKLIDIAFNYGYHSYEVFSRAFKKYYGYSPKEWRKLGDVRELFPRVHLLTIYNDKGEDVMIRVSNIEEYLKIVESNSEIGEYILCFDIDRFGSYNRQYGWQIGDLVIEAAASRIDKHIDEHMESYRIGADEFIVLTKSIHKEKILEIVKRILLDGNEVIHLQNENLTFSMSVGIVQVDEQRASQQAILAKAQEAMIKAKQLGRNCFYENV